MVTSALASEPGRVARLGFDWRGPDDPAREMVERLEPVIIADVSARFEHFNEEAHGAGRVKGWMAIPLLVGDRLIGMLTVDSFEADVYTVEHANLATAFAAFAATAIEKARYVAELEANGRRRRRRHKRRAHFSPP
jgi:GAF domain-containing protein